MACVFNGNDSARQLRKLCESWEVWGWLSRAATGTDGGRSIGVAAAQSISSWHMGCAASVESPVRVAPTSAPISAPPSAVEPTTASVKPSADSHQAAVPLSSSNLKVSTLVMSPVIPDDLSAFPAALADGHGGDTTQRFARQSMGRISSVRNSVARKKEGQDSRLSNVQLSNVLASVVEDMEATEILRESLISQTQGIRLPESSWFVFSTRLH